MTLSDNLFRKWYDHAYVNLECAKRERREFERTHNEGNDKNIFLLPHEFLFLLCNSTNRLDMINKVHKHDLTSDHGIIYQWEISGGRPTKQMKESG